MCDHVVEFHPEVVSFHFGLPQERLLRKVQDSGAGGHRGMILMEDVFTQVGTMVPQVVDAVKVPLIADARGI
jgi:nitronate monooxygenase